MSGFFVAPNEVFQDQRLSLIQVRVLCALYSYRDGRSTNLVYPRRCKLAARCGYAEATVSRATGDLVKLGWLKKVGKGGRSRAVRYEILDASEVAQTVTDPVTVSSPQNGDRSGQGFAPKTVTDPVTKTVTDPVTRIEETKEETKSSSCARASLRKALLGLVNDKGLALWRMERFASVRVQRMLDVWVDRGVSADDVLAVMALLRMRGVVPGSPSYLEGPMQDYLDEQSGEAQAKRETRQMPREDDALPGWASRQGLSQPKVGESYRDYRGRLRGELERRT